MCCMESMRKWLLSWLLICRKKKQKREREGSLGCLSWYKNPKKNIGSTISGNVEKEWQLFEGNLAHQRKKHRADAAPLMTEENRSKMDPKGTSTDQDGPDHLNPPTPGKKGESTMIVSKFSLKDADRQPFGSQWFWEMVDLLKDSKCQTSCVSGVSKQQNEMSKSLANQHNSTGTRRSSRTSKLTSKMAEFTFQNIQQKLKYERPGVATKLKLKPSEKITNANSSEVRAQESRRVHVEAPSSEDESSNNPESAEENGMNRASPIVSHISAQHPSAAPGSASVHVEAPSSGDESSNNTESAEKNGKNWTPRSSSVSADNGNHTPEASETNSWTRERVGAKVFLTNSSSTTSSPFDSFTENPSPTVTTRKLERKVKSLQTTPKAKKSLHSQYHAGAGGVAHSRSTVDIDSTPLTDVRDGNSKAPQVRKSSREPKKTAKAIEAEGVMSLSDMDSEIEDSELDFWEGTWITPSKSNKGGKSKTSAPRGKKAPKPAVGTLSKTSERGKRAQKREMELYKAFWKFAEVQNLYRVKVDENGRSLGPYKKTCENASALEDENWVGSGTDSEEEDEEDDRTNDEVENVLDDILSGDEDEERTVRKPGEVDGVDIDPTKPRRLLPTRRRNEFNKPIRFKNLTKLEVDSLPADKENGWMRENNIDTQTESIIKQHEPVPWIEEFTETSGLKIKPREETPSGYFHLLFPTQMYDVLAYNTSRHIKEIFRARQEAGIKKYCRYKTAQEPTRQEIILIFAHLLIMGVIPKPKLENFWTTDEMTQTPFFGKYMSRNRFQLIFWNLHSENESRNPKKRGDDGYDPFFRIGPLVREISLRFRQVYTPNKNLSYDELTWKFHGRGPGKHFNKSKPDKEHFLCYAVCDAHNGYLIGFDIHTGKQHHLNRKYDMAVPQLKQKKDERKVDQQVLWHMKQLDLLGKGHHVYTDNMYTSVPLMLELQLNKTYMCGTFRKRRQCMPKAFEHKHLRTVSNKTGTSRQKVIKMKKGDVMYRRFGSVLGLKFEDRKTVCFMTNIHRAILGVLKGELDEEDAQNSRPRGEKPVAVLDYNKYMGGVDGNGHLQSGYPCIRTTRSWHLKLLLHIFDCTVTNAYILYHLNEENKLSHHDFCVQLARELLEISLKEQRVVTKTKEQRVVTETRPHPQTMTRLTPGMHLPGKKANQTRCVACKDPESGHRRSCYFCTLCRVTLCIYPCFAAFHEREDYRQFCVNERLKQSNKVPEIVHFRQTPGPKKRKRDTTDDDLWVKNLCTTFSQQFLIGS